jgi:hypothetical protein
MTQRLDLFFFHKALMVVAIVFCLAFAVRTLAIAVDQGRNIDIETVVMGLMSALASVGLVRYLRWLVRTKAPSVARDRP